MGHLGIRPSKPADIRATCTSRRIVTDRGDNGRRLDCVLRRHLADIGATRTQIQAWIEQGLVSIDGRAVSRAAVRTMPSAILRIVLPHREPRAELSGEPIPIDVLYEDNHLLVVNKPAGLVVHPTYRHASGTLLNALMWRARSWPHGQRPSLVSRLDRLTSGLVIVAKSAEIHAALQHALLSPRGDKDYLAVVYGRMKGRRGSIDLRLEPDSSNRRTIVASRTRGASSLTEFERIGQIPALRAGLSLLRCRLVTGRRHQIRVHLSASGWPIVGDPMYGVPRWTQIVDSEVAATVRAVPRQALHAWRVGFVHPVSHEPVVVEAPVPADLQRLMMLFSHFLDERLLPHTIDP